MEGIKNEDLVPGGVRVKKRDKKRLRGKSLCTLTQPGLIRKQRRGRREGYNEEGVIKGNQLLIRKLLKDRLRLRREKDPTGERL